MAPRLNKKGHPLRSVFARRRRATVSLVPLILIVLATSILAACGGGGGGGGGGDSTPAGAFTLSANTATFSVFQDAAAPAGREIAMNITGSKVAYVGAAYEGGQTQPSWLGIDLTGSGSTYKLVLSVLSTSLPAGQYSSTFAVGTADDDGKVLQKQNVTVTYTVTAGIAMTASPLASSFVFGDTRTTATVAIDVQAANRQWTLASDADWLQVPGGSRTGDAAVNGTIDVGGLAPGSYSATVSATSSADAADSASFDVAVVVMPASFTVVQDAVLLGGADGRSNTLQQTVNFSLATGNGVHPYTVTLQTDDGGAWLSADSTAGMVGSAGAAVKLTASRVGLAGGTRTGQLTISANVNGTIFTEVRPVTFNTEASRIVTTASGIGLSRVPGRDVLTRRVKVLSNLGRTDVPWAATANQSWLTVTATGVTGEEIVITADPTGLASGVTHFADVTIGSPDATVENQQSIRVGLHLAAAAPVTSTVAANTAFLAASPVEPLVATNDGLGGSIALYDVYTGALVRTLAEVVGQAGGMAWSGDGRTLFVHDLDSETVVALSPATGLQLASYDASGVEAGDTVGLALAYLRPAGFPMLVAPGSRLFDLAIGAERTHPDFRSASNAVSLAVSPDQSLVVSDFGTVQRFERTALDGGALLVDDGVGFSTVQGKPGEACVAAAGDRIYSASGYPYEFPASSVATGVVVQQLPGSNYPNSIQCVWNGLVVGGIDGYYASTDIWVYYGPTGAALAQLSSSVSAGYRSLIDRGLAVSADGTRLVSAAREAGQSVTQLYFQALPPPP